MTLVFLRRPEVERRTGLKRSTLYAKIKNGDFPSPVKLGSRAVAWPEPEINTWLSERLEARVRRLERERGGVGVQPLRL